MIRAIFYASLYIFLYASFNVAGAAIIKLQLKGKNLTTLQEWLSFLMNPSFIIAFSLIVFSALAMFKALATGSFSMIIPIATGINFILTIGVGYYLFQDKLSFFSFIGIILIISGIIVLSLNNHTHAP